MDPQGTGAPAAGSLRALAISLRIGAVWDWAFALTMLAAPQLLRATFGLPLPGERFYLNVVAALLAIVGAVWWVAANDPEGARPIVWIAVGGRFLGFALLAVPAIGRPELAGLWVAAFGDLAFAIAHFVTGRRLLLA
jgi:hypothetical protein